MTESKSAQIRRKKRKRIKPVGSPKYAALTGAAGGAMIGAIATRVVDRTANAVENGVAKAAEKHMSRKSDTSWEQAAKSVR